MRRLVAAVVVSLGAGCHGDASCVEVSVEEIELDEATPESAAFRANEGRYQASLTWRGAENTDEVDVDPSSGATELEIELGHGSGPSRVIRHERVGGHPNERLFCPGEIELGVQLRMQSADGALDGTWDAIVSQPYGDSRISVTVDPTGPDNDGDFSARPILPQAWEDGSIEVELTSVFAAGGVTGHIEVRARRQDEDTTLQAVTATWTGERIDD